MNCFSLQQLLYNSLAQLTEITNQKKSYLFQIIPYKRYAAIIVQIGPGRGESILGDEDLNVTIMFFDPSHLPPYALRIYLGETRI